MPKLLCLTGLVVAGLIALIFLMDLVFGLAGMSALAPFKKMDWGLDVTMLFSSIVLGILSWFSFKELK
jgi:hypothetical protein